MSRLLQLVPAARSPRWLVAFVVGTGVLATGLIAAGSMNRAAIDGRVVFNVTAVSILLVGVLSGLGWLGARATFACAMLGLALGYAHMVSVFVSSRDGFADLAALAGFLMLGAIGIGIGVLIDLVSAIARRRRRDNP